MNDGDVAVNFSGVAKSLSTSTTEIANAMIFKFFVIKEVPYKLRFEDNIK